jgi:type II secretory pathway component PulC
MINKIKDFLKKKLNRNASHDLSDQDEFLDDDSIQNDQTNPSVKPAQLDTANSTGKFQLQNFEGDETNEASAPREGLNFKNKFSSVFQSAREKLSGIKFSKKNFSGLSLKSNGTSLISPNLINGIEKVLSRSSRETIHQIGLIAIICSVTYSLGKVTALVMRGTPILDNPKDYSVNIPLDDEFNPGTLAQVKSINIFRTNTGLGSKKSNVADTKCDESQQKSNLPIKLLNTIVLQDTVKSLASVQIRGERELQEFRVGDQISNLAKIFKITRLELLVKNLENGACESISSDLKSSMQGSPISVMTPAQSREYKANKKLPGIENNGNKFAISKTLLDEKLKDIAAVLTQAKAVQIQNPDGSLAFKMTELDPQGIFPYLGIQDQDIITSINGKPIYDMNEVMLLFGRIKGLDNLSLGIKREGSDSVQEYSIKK